MSRIRSRNTKLDLAMVQILKKSGVQYDMYPKVEGNPDFIVEKRVVVFCDSSFWHGRNWSSLRRRLLTGSRPHYWVSHIQNNRRRDREVSGKLTKMGYVVVRLWDDQVLKDPDLCANKLRETLLQTGNGARRQGSISRD